MAAARPEIRMLQALRALACLMVLGYHALPARVAAAWPNGSAGVDLFFTLSGFLMATTRAENWRIFVWRRFWRIVPLYWGLSFVKLGVALVAPGLTPHTVATAWNILASFLFIPARNGLGDIRPVLPVGWTLDFEVFFYALLACALAWRRPALAVVLPVLGALSLASFWRQPDWPAPLFLANGLTLEFCVGLAIGLVWQRFPPPRPSPQGGGGGPCIDTIVVARPLGMARVESSGRDGRWVGTRKAVLMAAAGMGLLLTLPLAGPWRFLVWGGPAAMGLIGALGLEPVGRRVPAALLAIGDASYAIYLLHPLLLPALGVWLGVPASLGLGSLLHDRVDRPLQRWLRAARPVRAAPAAKTTC